MKLLLFLGLCSLPAFGAACTMQTILGTESVSSGPAKINANFTCLNNNTPKIFSGATVPATVTGSRVGDFYLRTGTNTTYQCFSVSPSPVQYRRGGELGAHRGNGRRRKHLEHDIRVEG